MKFTELNLKPEILQALDLLGYEDLTPIQEETFTHIMAGRDIIVAYTRIANALTNSSTSARISGKAKAVFQGAAMFVLVVVAWLASPAGSVHELSWLRWLDAETVRMIQAVTGIVVIVATGWSLIDYIRGTLPAIRQLRQR